MQKDSIIPEIIKFSKDFWEQSRDLDIVYMVSLIIILFWLELMIYSYRVAENKNILKISFHNIHSKIILDNWVTMVFLNHTIKVVNRCSEVYRDWVDQINPTGNIRTEFLKIATIWKPKFSNNFQFWNAFILFLQCNSQMKWVR